MGMMINPARFAAAGGGVSPITFVGAKTVGFTSGATSQVISLTDLKDATNSNATLQAGDIVIVTYAMANGGFNIPQSILLPTGYTALHTDLLSSDSNTTNFQVSYKKMGGTPDTTVTLANDTGTGAGRSAHIMALRGVHGTTPVDTTAQTATGINSALADPPAITPVTAGAMITVHAGGAAGTGAAFTNPGDLSATTNHFKSTNWVDTVDAIVGVGLKNDWASGSFDPAQWGGASNTTQDSWAAATCAWRPA